MGLLRGIARTAVAAGTAKAASNRVSHRQAGRWATQDQAEQPVDEAPPDDMSSKLDQLKQLGELKDSGVLTAAEFEQQKAQILAS
jgi:hypothetical protein